MILVSSCAQTRVQPFPSWGSTSTVVCAVRLRWVLLELNHILISPFKIKASQWESLLHEFFQLLLLFILVCAIFLYSEFRLERNLLFLLSLLVQNFSSSLTVLVTPTTQFVLFYVGFFCVLFFLFLVIAETIIPISTSFPLYWFNFKANWVSPLTALENHTCDRGSGCMSLVLDV